MRNDARGNAKNQRVEIDLTQDTYEETANEEEDDDDDFEKPKKFTSTPMIVHRNQTRSVTKSNSNGGKKSKTNSVVEPIKKSANTAIKTSKAAISKRKREEKESDKEREKERELENERKKIEAEKKAKEKRKREKEEKKRRKEEEEKRKLEEEEKKEEKSEEEEEEDDSFTVQTQCSIEEKIVMTTIPILDPEIQKEKERQMMIMRIDSHHERKQEEEKNRFKQENEDEYSEGEEELNRKRHAERTVMSGHVFRFPKNSFDWMLKYCKESMEGPSMDDSLQEIPQASLSLSTPRPPFTPQKLISNFHKESLLNSLPTAQSIPNFNQKKENNTEIITCNDSDLIPPSPPKKPLPPLPSSSSSDSITATHTISQEELASSLPLKDNSQPIAPSQSNQPESFLTPTKSPGDSRLEDALAGISPSIFLTPRSQSQCHQPDQNAPYWLQSQSCIRLVVDSIREERNHGILSKIFTSTAESGEGSPYEITLKGIWVPTAVQKGDTVNIIAPRQPQDRKLEVNDSYGLIVLNPDLLVTGTRAADSQTCLRQTILMDNFKVSRPSVPMVHGNIVHQMFEEAMRMRAFDSEFLKTSLLNAVRDNSESLYAVDQKVQVAYEQLQHKIQFCKEFKEKYMNSDKPAILDFNKFGNTLTGPNEKRFFITKVLSVEENIWAPKFGCKGKTDIIVEASVQDLGVENSSSQKSDVMPLELKTGKQNMSHLYQSMLYSIIASEHYHQPVNHSLLLNIKENVDMGGITCEDDGLKSILLRRNEIASYQKNQKVPFEKKLPPPILKEENQKACTYCDQKHACAIYYKIENNEKEPMNANNKIFLERSHHLQPHHLEYFKIWDMFLDEEIRHARSNTHEIWTMKSEEREKDGRCFGKMALIKNEKRADKRYTIAFKQKPRETEFNLLEQQIFINDFVTLSTETNRYGLGQGWVKKITEDEIQIEMEEPLQSTPIMVQDSSSSNRKFLSITEIEQSAEALRSPSESPIHPVRRDNVNFVSDEKLWRIDRCDLKSGVSLAKQNLVNLLSEGGDRERRRLIVDLESPRFNMDVKAPKFEGWMSTLNEQQREAATMVSRAQDYLLIVGPPGTGKTDTLVAIVKTIVDSGKTVLISSYTHSATDNLCLKLMQRGVDVLRIGRDRVVHQDVKPLTVESHKERMKNLNPPVYDLQGLFNGAKVVATTCLGINSPIFSKKTFDYCIVDEASQVTQPICLGPIRLAKTFVLVGDDKQLQPISKRRDEAISSQIDNPKHLTIFALLQERHPQAVVYLTVQYRMNKDIMLLCNHLTYEHKLSCGNEQVSNRIMKIPQPNKAPNPSFNKEDWMKTILDPSRTVLFLNTDKMRAVETKNEDSVKNESESKLVFQIVSTMVHCGVDPKNLGVISPYNAQLKMIMRSMSRTILSNVEVHTVDRFQGRDKECIIFSLVRSNGEGLVGELLKEVRRINVALTRAKSKLIIIGSRNTIQNEPLWEDLFQLMTSEGRNWIVNLPSDALEVYPDPNTFIPPSQSTQRSPIKQTNKGPRRRLLQEE
eukprot:TRINITY_DN3308_c1_g1_i1.p1 TRINITY_DN3308_c1_g1~~TRINITY_DN3308_c1_g1_i1.p1  ORF type:complete len:1558 (+),score=542.81 TRINITY_DN3308_c1_g1_i1:102-4676(+)